MIVSQEGYPYRFDSRACETCKGRCCNGESGNIWVNRQEIETIAAGLSMETETFIRVYLKKVGYRFSIRELKIRNNYACVFYDQEKNGCAIYGTRPEQCRTFPFWLYYKDKADEVAEECPGVIRQD